MDQRRQWLFTEIEDWEKERLVTKEEAEALRERYRRGRRAFSWTLPLFAAASFCFLAGAFFLVAGFWGALSQDGRFTLALAPVVVSLLAVAAFLASGKGRAPRAPLVPAPEGGEEIFVEPPPASGGLHEALREAAGLFHGLSVLAAFWMVHDSFQLTPAIDPLAGVAAALLLVMLYVLHSVGLGILFTAAAALYAWTSPTRGLPLAAAWTLLAFSLPFFFQLVSRGRKMGGILFAWAWMAAVLLLTFCSAEGQLWQMLFFSAIAALTWLLGAALRSYGRLGMALRFFGGASVFCVLVAASFGAAWRQAEGGALLWGLLLVFLAADAALLYRTAAKKEWLSTVAGLTPFIMAAAGLLAFWDATGAISATLVSCFALVLAAAVAARGLRMGRRWQLAAAAALLAVSCAVRLSDGALSFGERGVFFFLVGLPFAAAAFASWSAGKISARRKRKLARIEELTQEESPVEIPAEAPADVSQNQTEGGGENG